MTYEIRKLPNATQIRCTDCGSWVHACEGGTVRHSKRCDFASDETFHTPLTVGEEARAESGAAVPVTTVARVKKLQTLAKDGSLGQDRTYELYKQGLISGDDAMNQDF